MDIMTEGLGFMLVAAGYLWMPFTFGVQARYLAFRHIVLGWPASLAVFCMNFTGYWIFRSSNAEKNNFRNGKNPKSQ
jgi:Delta14-sterol reductase